MKRFVLILLPLLLLLGGCKDQAAVETTAPRAVSSEPTQAILPETTLPPAVELTPEAVAQRGGYVAGTDYGRANWDAFRRAAEGGKDAFLQLVTLGEDGTLYPRSLSHTKDGYLCLDPELPDERRTWRYLRRLYGLVGGTEKKLMISYVLTDSLSLDFDTYYNSIISSDLNDKSPAYDLLSSEMRTLPLPALTPTYSETTALSFRTAQTETPEAYVQRLQDEGFTLLESAHYKNDDYRCDTYVLQHDDLLVRVEGSTYFTVRVTLDAPTLQDGALGAQEVEALCAKAQITPLLLTELTPDALFPRTGAQLFCAVCRETGEEGDTLRRVYLLCGENGVLPLEGLLPEEVQPVCGDLDGDGADEIVVWSYGPTSGLFTVRLSVYRMRGGVPEAVTDGVFVVNYAQRVALCAEPDGVFLRLDDELLPVKLQDGALTMPPVLEPWG